MSWEKIKLVLGIIIYGGVSYCWPLFFIELMNHSVAKILYKPWTCGLIPLVLIVGYATKCAIKSKNSLRELEILYQNQKFLCILFYLLFSGIYIFKFN